jgi:tetratricopeptide (TPR) repeat protein
MYERVVTILFSGDEKALQRAAQRGEYIDPASLPAPSPLVGVHGLLYQVIARMAVYYEQAGEHMRAKDAFLTLARAAPSAFTWRGVGIACYHLGEHANAEHALAEANILDNKDPRVWAYLALLSVRAGRDYEFSQARRYAVSLGLSDDDAALKSELDRWASQRSETPVAVR